jgi:hypothetical protein
MKVQFLGAVVIASLLIMGAAAYAEEATPDSDTSIHLIRINRKNLDKLQKEQEQRKKEVEAKKAEEKGKTEKKAKVDKYEGKTGRKATSWQVLNR